MDLYVHLNRVAKGWVAYVEGRKLRVEGRSLDKVYSDIRKAAASLGGSSELIVVFDDPVLQKAYRGVSRSNQQLAELERQLSEERENLGELLRTILECDGVTLRGLAVLTDTPHRTIHRKVLPKTI